MELLIFIMVMTSVLHITVQPHAIVMVEQMNEDNYYIINIFTQLRQNLLRSTIIITVIAFI